MKEFIEANKKWLGGVAFTIVLAIALSILLGITPKDIISGVVTVTDGSELQVPVEDTKEPAMPIAIEDLEIPEYDGIHSYVIVNNNVPFFTEEEKKNTETFIRYSNLDELGRAGVAYANMTYEGFNTGVRTGDLSSVTPSGWNQINTKERLGMSLTYQDTTTNYLYARSHLIAWSLGGSELDPRGIVTVTAGCNLAMLEAETLIRDFLTDAKHDHVLYRVTPVYQEAEDLIPYGLLMEGYAVENKGLFVSYNIFVYNAQPELYGIAEIDYKTGEIHPVS